MNEAITQARQASATVPVGARERVWRRLQTRPAAATPSWVKGLAFVACTAAGFAVVSSFSARPAAPVVAPVVASSVEGAAVRGADGVYALGVGQTRVAARTPVVLQANGHRIESEAALFTIDVAANAVTVDVRDGSVRIDGERVLAGKRWNTPTEDQEWKLAEQSARTGDYPQAVKRFDALSGGLRAEAAILRKGELQLRELASPADALKTFDRGLERFPKGSLTQELALSSIEATLALGHWSDARARSADFLGRFPQSERLHDVRYVAALAAWQLNDKSTTCAEIRSLQTAAFFGERRATLEKLAAQCSLFER